LGDKFESTIPFQAVSAQYQTPKPQKGGQGIPKSKSANTASKEEEKKVGGSSHQISG
jgi:hypothetical protein